MNSNPATGTLNGATDNVSLNQKRAPLRKKPVANPLVANRRTQKAKPNNLTPQVRPGVTNDSRNPAAGSSSLANRPVSHRPDFAIRKPSPEPGPPAHSYPVYLASPEELESMRYHLVRLQAKENIDVTDQRTFVRPVKLLRRDVTTKSDAPVGSDADKQQDADAVAEKERHETIKAERQRQKEEVAKQIAPSETKKKPVAGKRKTESRLGIETAADEKRRLLRYEETLPWILEDFEEQRTWVGSYEASLSECHVLLIRDQSGGFKLIPVEKSYRFKEKDRMRERINPDAEILKAQKKDKDPRFLVDYEKQKKESAKDGLRAKIMRGVKTGASWKDEPEESGLGGGGSREDMDFDQDELFADDEENPIFEGEEDDQKDAKEKIFADQRKANYFDLNDETAVLEQEERRQREAQEQKSVEKGTRKALIKREGNYAYEDSDDENPYASQSDEEDDEANQQADQEKKDAKAGDAVNLNGSGTSTKGANTPSDRKKLLKGLKRPGSPNLSEASGNESTRKKAKLHKGIKRATDVDASGASGNESAYKKKTAASKLGGRGPLSLGASMRSGSGSDTDTVKRSRGTLSASNTPAGTRAQSPATTVKGKGKISRAASPAVRDDTPAGRATSAAPGASGNSTPRAVTMPTPDEVLNVIPAQGILMPDLLAHFESREGWTRDHSRSLFSGLKSKVDFDKTTKRITKK